MVSKQGQDSFQPELPKHPEPLIIDIESNPRSMTKKFQAVMTLFALLLMADASI